MLYKIAQGTRHLCVYVYVWGECVCGGGVCVCGGGGSLCHALALPPSLPPSLSRALSLSRILYSHESRCVIGLAVSADLGMCVLKSVYIDLILAKKCSVK